MGRGHLCQQWKWLVAWCRQSKTQKPLFPLMLCHQRVNDLNFPPQWHHWGNVNVIGCMRPRKIFDYCPLNVAEIAATEYVIKRLFFIWFGLYLCCQGVFQTNNCYLHDVTIVLPQVSNRLHHVLICVLIWVYVATVGMKPL